jgi:hypothetical protein
LDTKNNKKGKDMKTSLKLVLTMVLALILGGMVTNAALAFDCNNPNINDNALLGEFNIATGTFTPYKANWGSFDQLHGAYVKLVFPTGNAYNVWVHGILPSGALDAGPGNNLCDGVGIDDTEACLAALN